MTPYTQLQTCLPAQPHTWLDTGVAGFNRDFPLGNSTRFPPLTAEGSLRSNGEPTGVPLAGAKGDRGGGHMRATFKSPLTPYMAV